MIQNDETLEYLVSPMGESRVGIETLVDRHTVHGTQIDTYQDKDGFKRKVIWQGTLIVSAIRYVQRGEVMVIDKVFTREPYRRMGFAAQLFLRITEKQVTVPMINSESGAAFFKAMGL